MRGQLLQTDQRLRKTGFWLLVGFGLVGVIIYFSMTSSTHIPTPGQMDKLYHALAYAVVMGWWLQLFPNPTMRLLLVLIFITLGVGIEVLQSFHPLRHFDVLDMLANSAGTLLAWLLGVMGFDQILYRVERYIWRN